MIIHLFTTYAILSQVGLLLLAVKSILIDIIIKMYFIVTSLCCFIKSRIIIGGRGKQQ